MHQPGGKTGREGFGSLRSLGYDVRLSVDEESGENMGEEPFGFAQGKISPSAKFWCGREDSNLHALRR